MRYKKWAGFGMIGLGSLLLLHVFQVLAVNLPDLAHLPLGDGKVSTTAQVGYIYLCDTQTNQQGGAGTDGPWIHSDGTFDPRRNASFDIAQKGMPS